MNYLKHAQAIVETINIGNETRIWAFVHILPGARIGEDCNIGEHTFIENDVVIGDRVTIKCGVQLWDGIRIEDDVFIGPNATFTNDPFPRSKHYPKEYPKTIVRKNASIGANATLLPGIEIGLNAMVGAGSVVTKSVPANAIVVGNPARIIGYDQTFPQIEPKLSLSTQEQIPRSLTVEGVKVFELPLLNDLRGNLSVAEYSKQLPFQPIRYFIVFDVPSKEIRGEHAHFKLEQFLVCIKGNCAIMVDDGRQRAEIVLNRPNIGLYIPPMVWSVQYKYSPDAVLLVLASDIYRSEDYIRDYDQFLHIVNHDNG